jgi:hypothetical protein
MIKVWSAYHIFKSLNNIGFCHFCVAHNLRFCLLVGYIINKVCNTSFGSHHLGLESKNLFMILTITCLAATELVMEFIWNSMGFHLMPNLNTYWVPCHFCEFFKMKWYHHCHFISFLSNEMKWWVPNKP